MKLDDFTISYAQNREDLIIDGFFKGRKKGFYVDVGAANPYLDSVTRLFYDKGWRGINIEPIGHIFKVLNEVRSRDINLNIGISNKQGSLLFREYASDGYSSFSTDIHRQYEQNPDSLTSKYIDYEVKIRTLTDVFTEHKIESIQFLKVDVEGYEYEVLSGNDWKKFRPELVCVEANHAKRDWRPLLTKNGYEKAYSDGLNEYYVSVESGLSGKFHYVEAIINKEPIVHHKLIPVFDELEGLREHVKNQKAHIHDLEKRIEEINSVSKHLKSAIKRRLHQNGGDSNK